MLDDVGCWMLLFLDCFETETVGISLLSSLYDMIVLTICGVREREREIVHYATERIE